MDTLLLGVYDFPTLDGNEEFVTTFPDADDVTIEYEWEEDDPSVGYVGGFSWDAYVDGVEITHMLSLKDIKFVEATLVSYNEEYC
jgi:glycyl-tRNA synthetase alpha subunit